MNKSSIDPRHTKKSSTASSHLKKSSGYSRHHVAKSSFDSPNIIRGLDGDQTFKKIIVSVEDRLGVATKFKKALLPSDTIETVLQYAMKKRNQGDIENKEDFVLTLATDIIPLPNTKILESLTNGCQLELQFLNKSKLSTVPANLDPEDEEIRKRDYLNYRTTLAEKQHKICKINYDNYCNLIAEDLVFSLDPVVREKLNDDWRSSGNLPGEHDIIGSNGNPGKTDIQALYLPPTNIDKLDSRVRCNFAGMLKITNYRLHWTPKSRKKKKQKMEEYLWCNFRWNCYGSIVYY